jgi:hypothetical protein
VLMMEFPENRKLGKKRWSIRGHLREILQQVEKDVRKNLFMS